MGVPSATSDPHVMTWNDNENISVLWLRNDLYRGGAGLSVQGNPGKCHPVTDGLIRLSPSHGWVDSASSGMRIWREFGFYSKAVKYFFIASDILSFLVCFGCPICKNTRSGERMQWSDASWCHRGNVILLQAINFNLIQMQLFSNYKHYFEIPSWFLQFTWWDLLIYWSNAK